MNRPGAVGQASRSGRDFGYLGIVMPMVAQFVQRFIGDAHRLQVLTQALGEEVQLATEERDVAREALAAHA